jgi:hypothetical protein
MNSLNNENFTLMKITLQLLVSLFLITFSQQNFAQSGTPTENVDIKLAKEQSANSLEYAKK